MKLHKKLNYIKSKEKKIQNVPNIMEHTQIVDLSAILKKHDVSPRL